MILLAALSPVQYVIACLKFLDFWSHKDWTGIGNAEVESEIELEM
jgi:hypothetical protein